MESVAGKMTSQLTYIGREICNIDGNWTRGYQQKCLNKIQCSKKYADHVEKEQGQNSHSRVVVEQKGNE